MAGQLAPSFMLGANTVTEVSILHQHEWKCPVCTRIHTGCGGMDWCSECQSLMQPSGSPGQLYKAPLTWQSTEPILESLPDCYLTVDLI